MKNKYRKWAGVLAMLLAMSMLAGCASETTGNKDVAGSKEIVPLEKEESNAVSFDFLGGKDVMPIGGFYGPYTTEFSYDGNDSPNYHTEEYMKMIADCGINLISASADIYSGDGKFIKKTLELGEKYGVGYFVYDGRISKDADAATAADLIRDYCDYPAFIGMRITDEPSTPYYQMNDNTVESWGNLSKIFHNEFDMTCYLNAFPLYDWMGTREVYERYIQEIIDTCSPKVLMWDYYVFEGYDFEYYFLNMDVIYQFAKKYNLPFWSFIQAGGNFDSKEGVEYKPNEAEFDWNVNTSLAMGAQGIQYFTLIQPVGTGHLTGTFDGYKEGLIGAWGNKQPWYYYAQNIHKHIGVIDEVLMNSVNKGIIVEGKQAVKDTKHVSCILESGSFQELMSVDGDAMVGCFNYNGKTALYVVNYSMKYAQNITLHFNEQHNIKQVQNAETSYVKAKDLTLDMAAGEGVLLVIE